MPNLHAADSDTMTPRPFVIDRMIRDVSDTFTVELSREGNEGAFRFRPGQFNMLYVFGVGEVPISISGDPDAGGPLVHTIRAVGPVTRAMARLKRGAVIGVRGPFGSAWPTEEAEGRDVVFVAGGVGLAPLRPAILRILARRGHYGRAALLYGARTPKDILFRHDLERWSARLDMTVDVTVDRAAAAWHGNVGVVTRLIGHAPFDPQETVALVCGPEIMLRFTIRALMDRGVRAECIHISMERNMKCAVGFCGHCQFGGHFVCRDGPVFRFDRIADIFDVREL
jgi:NAD(P)H-flavin reductase